MGNETAVKFREIQKYVSQDTRFAPHGAFDLLIYQDSNLQSGSLPCLWRILYGSQQAEKIKQYQSHNSASAETFQQILVDCRTASPSQKYGLWVFSHASGWLPEATLTNPRSVIVDQNREMDIKDFAAAIPDKFFDYIVFEACFMASIEVAYELKAKTNYLIASSAEMLSPGFSRIYHAALPALLANDLVRVSTLYFDHWQSQPPEKRAATISVIHTESLPKLAEITARIRENQVEVNPLSVQHFDRYPSHRLFFDLKEYLLQQATTLQSAQLTDVLKEVVIYSAFTNEFLLNERGFRINAHCGLTTYIMQPQFPYLNNQYGLLEWSKALDFID